MEERINNEINEQEQYNGIIVLGEMRVGKSNLIHLLTGKDVKVEISNHRVTTKVEAFEGIIDNKKVLYIDTVGFSDENDEKEKLNLKIFLNENQNIKIKKILIVINFQSQQFSKGLITCFENIASIFPMPEFWNRVILCYSHYLNNGFIDKESIKHNLEKDNKIGFENIMKNLKAKHKIIEIEYENIKKIYYDIYCEKDINMINSNEKQEEIRENNKKYKKIFEDELKNIFNDIPMYNSMKVEKKIMKFAKPSRKDPNKLEVREGEALLIEYYDSKNERIGKIVQPFKNFDDL